MPPLLCGSPCILDQSFPRDTHELNLVADTLGEIEKLVSENRIHLVLTEALKDLVLEFDWQTRGAQYALLLDIHRILLDWFLTPHDRLVSADTSAIMTAQPHPLPTAVDNQGWATLWAEEIGKLLVLHDAQCAPGFCIGIACEQAFTTGTPNTWQAVGRAFPLVGPTHLDSLEDAYEWEPPPSDLHQHVVSLDAALRNVRLLGSDTPEKPNGGSHYKIRFTGARSWTLSENDDPVPDRYVRELVAITGMPLPVIRTTLIYGRLPQRGVLRLH